MALIPAGNLRERSLGELVALLGHLGFTGVLRIKHAERRFAWHWASGRLVGAESSLPGDQLPRHLVEAGVISRAQAGAMLARLAENPEIGALDILVRMGTVPKQHAPALLKSNVLRRAARAFELEDGQFATDEQGRVRNENVLLDPMHLLVHGAMHYLPPSALSAALRPLANGWLHPQPAHLEAWGRMSSDPELVGTDMLFSGESRAVRECVSLGPGPSAVCYALSFTGGIVPSRPQLKSRAGQDAGLTFENDLPPVATPRPPTAIPVAAPRPPTAIPVAAPRPPTTIPVAPPVPSAFARATTATVPPARAPQPRPSTAPPQGHAGIIPPARAPQARPGTAPLQGHAGAPTHVPPTPVTTIPPATPASGAPLSRLQQLRASALSGPSSDGIVQAYADASASGAVPNTAPHVRSGAIPNAAPHAGSGPIPNTAPHAGSGPVPNTAPHAGSGPVPNAAPHAGSGPIPSAAPYASGTHHTGRASTASPAPTPQAKPLPAQTPADARRDILAKHASLASDPSHYVLLGVSQRDDASAIKAAYFKAAKLYHPDRLPLLQLEDLRSQVDALFARLATAFQVLSDPTKRKTYDSILAQGGEAAVKAREEAEQAQALAILHAEEVFLQGEAALRRQQIPQAKELFHKALDLAPNEPEHLALVAWVDWLAGRKTPQDLQTALKLLKQAGKENDKCAPAFFYLAMLAKHENQDAQALEGFKKVLRMRPGHREAESEIRFLQTKADKQKESERGLFGRFKKKT